MKTVGVIWTILFLGLAWAVARIDGALFEAAGWLFCLMAAGSVMYMFKGTEPELQPKQKTGEDKPSQSGLQQPAPAVATASVDTPNVSPIINSSIPPPAARSAPIPQANEEVPKGPVNFDPYQQAGEELLSGNLDPAIWARSLVEGAGNDGAVKAAYVKLRVAQLNAATQAAAEAARAKAEEENRRAEDEAARARGDTARFRAEELNRWAEAEAARARGDAARFRAEELNRWAEAEAARAKAEKHNSREGFEAAQAKAKEKEYRERLEALRINEGRNLKIIDPVVEEYAKINGLDYEEADLMMPWGIYKLGSQFVVYGYAFDRLEDAIRRGKRGR